jgi:hypothetical protein
MARRTRKMWVAAVAAGVLVACGAEPEDTSVLGTATEAGQEAPSERGEEASPSDPGKEGGGDGAEHDEGGDEGETPWHLLPEEDRPAPVEPVNCDRASPTPVAC